MNRGCEQKVGEEEELGSTRFQRTGGEFGVDHGGERLVDCERAAADRSEGVVREGEAEGEGVQQKLGGERTGGPSRRRIELEGLGVLRIVEAEDARALPLGRT